MNGSVKKLAGELGRHFPARIADDIAPTVNRRNPGNTLFRPTQVFRLLF